MRIHYPTVIASFMATMLGQTPDAYADSRPSMGFFAPWAQTADGTDLGGREANIRAREKALGLPPSSLLALDFYGADSWDQMKSYAWIPPYWKMRNPDRKLVWSIGLTMKDTPLKDIAAGAHDADFIAAAAIISAAHPDAVIRIGWEMNGDWFAWASKGVEREYVEAYRHVHGIFRKASPRFIFAWTPGAGQLASSPEPAYPGDDVVDTIGIDIYDLPSTDPPAKAWSNRYAEPFGLKWLEEFSSQHGKKMHLGEWGLGLRGAPDNPVFVEKMCDWLKAHGEDIAFHIFFDTTPSELDTGKFPKSRARFYEAFTAGRGARATLNCDR